MSILNKSIMKIISVSGAIIFCNYKYTKHSIVVGCNNSDRPSLSLKTFTILHPTTLSRHIRQYANRLRSLVEISDPFTPRREQFDGVGFLLKSSSINHRVPCDREKSPWNCGHPVTGETHISISPWIFADAFNYMLFRRSSKYSNMMLYNTFYK